MAIYDMEGSKPAPPLPQTLLNSTEYPIYGSSRIGNKTVTNITFQQADELGQYKRKQMQKGYELNNQLGNVLATVNDRKRGYEIGMANGIAEYYLADVATVSDYYAFGMQNMQRQYEANRYRYGFNGKERSLVMKTGNVYINPTADISFGEMIGGKMKVKGASSCRGKLNANLKFSNAKAIRFNVEAEEGTYYPYSKSITDGDVRAAKL